jgi:predicted acylesterase/phospholipase RssA
MGITIIQKSDLSVRKRDAKIALVLAGGALTGGAFKLGGLKALDDFLINRKVADFDIYVGLSAGALLGAPLAAGVSPSEMLRALDGTSVQFSRFRANDFYHLNSEELLKKPVEYVLDVMTCLVGTAFSDAALLPSLGNVRQRNDRTLPAAKSRKQRVAQRLPQLPAPHRQRPLHHGNEPRHGRARGLWT